MSCLPSTCHEIHPMWCSILVHFGDTLSSNTGPKLPSTIFGKQSLIYSMIFMAKTYPKVWFQKQNRAWIGRPPKWMLYWSQLPNCGEPLPHVFRLLGAMPGFCCSPRGFAGEARPGRVFPRPEDLLVRLRNLGTSTLGSAWCQGGHPKCLPLMGIMFYRHSPRNKQDGGLHGNLRHSETYGLDILWSKN